MKKPYFFSALLCIFTLGHISLNAHAGDWNGKRAAVVFTFDDSVNEHLDKAAPILDQYNMKGTFYLTANFDGLRTRIDEWRKLAKNGHELANHTLVHPCVGNTPGREWVSKEKDLSTWSVQRMVDDIVATNIVLEAIDGETQRTFAYPCGDQTAMGQSYVPQIAPMFIAARGVGGGPELAKDINLMSIHSYMVNGESADKLNALVDQAIKEKKLLVFLFHGIDGGHPLDIKLDDFKALVAHIDSKKQQLWVDTMKNVAVFVKEQKR